MENLLRDGAPSGFNMVTVDPMGNFTQGVKQLHTRDLIERDNKEYADQQEIDNIVSSLLSKDHISVEDIAPLIAKSSPEKAANIYKAYSLKTEEQKKNTLQVASMVMSALSAGKPEIASKILRNQAEAQKNSGDMVGFHFSDENANIIDSNPQYAKLSGAMYLASLGDEGAKILNAIYNQRRAEQLDNISPIERRIKEAEAQKIEDYNSPEEKDLRNQERNAKISALKAKSEAKGIQDEYPRLAEYVGNELISPTVFKGNRAYMSALEQGLENFHSKPENEGKFMDINGLIKDARQASATGAAAGGTKVLNARSTIDTSRSLISDMEKTITKLDFSRKNKYAGKLELWAKDFENDPTLTEWRTQRTDSIFNITNALKQNNITDIALKMEDRTAVESMSPDQFLQWAKVQTKALKRIADQYDKNYGKRVDWSNRQTRSAAPAVSGEDFLNKYGK